MCKSIVPCLTLSLNMITLYSHCTQPARPSDSTRETLSPVRTGRPDRHLVCCQLLIKRKWSWFQSIYSTTNHVSVLGYLTFFDYLMKIYIICIRLMSKITKSTFRDGTDWETPWSGIDVVSLLYSFWYPKKTYIGTSLVVWATMWLWKWRNSVQDPS